jgi:crossover junction endodeoxyribonuclease RusA
MITLQLPLAPSVNRLWRIGNGGKMYKSPEYKAWLEEAGWMVKEQTKDQILGEYVLHILAVKPDKRKRDLDNLLKATSDLLVQSGVISDDSACRALAAEWNKTPEYAAPMIVKIYPLDGDEQCENLPQLMN